LNPGILWRRIVINAALCSAFHREKSVGVRVAINAQQMLDAAKIVVTMIPPHTTIAESDKLNEF
jgi:hypothetical protein